MNRRIDDLGRLVIPREMMNTLGIKAGDEVTISMDNYGISIVKAQTVDLQGRLNEILNSEMDDAEKLETIKTII